VMAAGPIWRLGLEVDEEDEKKIRRCVRNKRFSSVGVAAVFMGACWFLARGFYLFFFWFASFSLLLAQSSSVLLLMMMLLLIVVVVVVVNCCC